MLDGVYATVCISIADQKLRHAGTITEWI